MRLVVTLFSRRDWLPSADMNLHRNQILTVEGNAQAFDWFTMEPALLGAAMRFQLHLLTLVSSRGSPTDFLISLAPAKPCGFPLGSALCSWSLNP